MYRNRVSICGIMGHVRSTYILHVQDAQGEHFSYLIWNAQNQLGTIILKSIATAMSERSRLDFTTFIIV